MPPNVANPPAALRKNLPSFARRLAMSFPPRTLRPCLLKLSPGMARGQILILIDSNIPMYLVGAAHPHKTDAQRLLERLVSDRERLVTDAEVLQEIMHRYAAINRPSLIQSAFDSVLGIVDSVLPIDLRAANRAKEILLGIPALAARDALHLAIMEINGIDRILSFDSGFDRFPGVSRIA
jgi:predicted nucleic acid-binding protein